MEFYVHALWVWLLNKNFATHFKGNKITHMLIFHSSVHISLRPVPNHTLKKNLYIGLIAVATVHMGKGIAHMIYVRTFSFRSALGNRKAVLRQVFLPVLLFTLSVSFHQRSILIFTYMFTYQKDETNGRNVGTFTQSKHFWVSKGVRRVRYWIQQYFHIEMKAVCWQSHLLTHRLQCPCSAFRPQPPRVHPSGAEKHKQHSM